MRQNWSAWLAPLVVSLGISLITLGMFAVPRVGYADGGTGPYCNEGGDPSMPKGCYGWCYSPKICEIHPVQLICMCR